jgi:O-antigen/teichoic acid export membrane protein
MIYFEIISIIIIMTHGMIMCLDEFYFHHKRKLPKWERLGHPVDTLFFFSCFLIVLFFPMTKLTVILFFILSFISSLIIVKDEFIHAKCCCIKENYLHALLFVFHPILLIILFLSWSSFTNSYFSGLENFNSIIVKNIIYFQFVTTVLFFIYQIVFWNFIYKEKSKL